MRELSRAGFFLNSPRISSTMAESHDLRSTSASPSFGISSKQAPRSGLRCRLLSSSTPTPFPGHATPSAGLLGGTHPAWNYSSPITLVSVALAPCHRRVSTCSIERPTSSFFKTALLRTVLITTTSASIGLMGASGNCLL